MRRTPAPCPSTGGESCATQNKHTGAGGTRTKEEYEGEWGCGRAGLAGSTVVDGPCDGNSSKRLVEARKDHAAAFSLADAPWENSLFGRPRCVISPLGCHWLPSDCNAS